MRIYLKYNYGEIYTYCMKKFSRQVEHEIYIGIKYLYQTKTYMENHILCPDMLTIYKDNIFIT